MSNLDELLNEIANYADQLAQSEGLADRGSLPVAHKVAALYESRTWVDEWAEQHPIREAKAYIGGRPPQPDSRNRFSQWLIWKQEQRGRRPVVSRHTYRLLNAHDLSEVICPTGQITSERAVRPLDWLRKNRYFERAPEIWKMAVEAAGGDAAWVTSKHTAEALKRWKAENIGGRKELAKVSAHNRAETKRRRAMAEVRDLFRMSAQAGKDDEWFKFDEWYRNFRKTGHE